MKQSPQSSGNIYGIFVFGILVIHFLFVTCTTHDRDPQQAFQGQLTLADSLSHFEPKAGDSIYRFLVSRPDLAGSNIRIKALLGVSTGFINGGQVDSAGFYLDMAFRQALEKQDTMLILRCYLEKGNLYLDPGEFSKAETEFILGLNFAKKTGNFRYQEKFLLSLASIKASRGDYAGAMKMYLLGLKMAADQNNKISEAYAYEQIGMMLSHNKDHIEAVEYLRKAIALRQSLNMSRELASALQNLGIVYRRANQPDSSMVLYGKALDIYTGLGDQGKMIMVRYNIAVLLKNEERFQQALDEFRIVLSESKKMNILQGQIYAYSSMADIFHKTGRASTALQLIDSAIFLAGKINDRSNAPAFFERKSEILVSQSNYKEAWLQMKRFISLHDSILSEEKQKEVTRLKMASETERKELQIKFLQVDNQYKTTRIRLMSIAFISVMIILFMIFLILRNRIVRLRLSKEVAEEKTLRLDEARLREQAENERLELKTRLQEQELVYRTLVETDITQLNRSVKEKMLPFRVKIARKADQEEFARAIQELSRDSNHDPLAQFDILFRELHPGFYASLIKDFPLLTPSELQICALIRLNFSSKDIARLMSLSVATVETTRSHIRKKLNMDVKDNLSVFLLSR